MNYKKFGKDDFDVSILGFGCMRFPLLDDKAENIDKEKAIEMIRYAIDNGVNYIDTAYPYHNGKSEGLVALALKDGYREKVKIADKLPTWLIRSDEDLDKYLNEQLERLDDKFIDYYLIHALNETYFETVKKRDITKWCEEKQKEGKIGKIGFSFHDSLDLFKEIIDYYDWDFCQIQLNYMDTDYQAGLEGLEYAHKKGIPVIVMEPIRGGSLSAEPEGDIKEIYENSSYSGTPAELALKWVWNRPEVTLLLSGMSTLEQVKENIEVASRSREGCLTDVEEMLVKDLVKIYKDRIKVPCTKCEYCLPCPEKVNIPRIFGVYNNLFMYKNKEGAKSSYSYIKRAKVDASRCVECGQCEEKCPQAIKIIEELKNAEKAILG